MFAICVTIYPMPFSQSQDWIKDRNKELGLDFQDKEVRIAHTIQARL